MEQQDTITAISTPSGNGAIGIVRLSGSQSIEIIDKLWSGAIPARDFAPRRVYVGKIKAGREVLDQVLVFFMKSPNSYTGEDLVEIQGHGGQRLLEAILQNLIKAGAKLAEPGEFTKRAFLNGRIDLVQAEAVADLIQSTSLKGAELAERQLEGKLSESVGKLRTELKEIRSRLEATIDFSEEEDVSKILYPEIKKSADRIKIQIQKLLDTYEEGRAYREGVRVAIVGKPNVGKSSLFNRLLGENRSIVHLHPGTTRDLVEESIQLQGLRIRFIDTAGLRKGREAVEAEGIERARKRIGQSDLVLMVLDQSRPLDFEDDFVMETSQGKPSLCLLNKNDLTAALQKEEVTARYGHLSIHSVSAKTGDGINQLKEAIFSSFVRHPEDNSELILTNLRHRNALEKGLVSILQIIDGARKSRPLDLLTQDVSDSMYALGEVTGEVTNDEILNEIFSKFCVGK